MGIWIYLRGLWESRSRPTPAETVYLSHLDGRLVKNVPDEDPFWKRDYRLRTGRAVKRLLRFGCLTVEGEGQQARYVLTGSGKQLLKESEHLLYLSDLKLSTPLRADALRREQPELDAYGVARETIDQRMREHRQKGEWGRYRDDLMMQSSNSGQERDFRRAVFWLFQVCWFDWNGRRIPGYCDGTRKEGLVVVNHLEWAARNAGLSWEALPALCRKAVAEIPKQVQKRGGSADELWEEIRRRMP